MTDADYDFLPPYSRGEFDCEYEKFFGRDGITSEYQLVHAKSDLVHYDLPTSENRAYRANSYSALDDFKNDYYHYIKTSAELEGFSTTESEVYELLNTDELSSLKSSNNNDLRLSTIASLVEGFKKVIDAVVNDRPLDAKYLCDLNASFAYPTLKESAGSFRGEIHPNLSTRITFGSKMFIPLSPEYGVRNIRADFEAKLHESANFPAVKRALWIESNNVYNQYFSDGNNRTSFYFAITMLLQNGLPAFRVEQWNAKDFVRTKPDLFLNGDATAREKLLYDSMFVL